MIVVGAGITLWIRKFLIDDRPDQATVPQPRINSAPAAIGIILLYLGLSLWSMFNVSSHNDIRLSQVISMAVTSIVIGGIILGLTLIRLNGSSNIIQNVGELYRILLPQTGKEWWDQIRSGVVLSLMLMLPVMLVSNAVTPWRTELTVHPFLKLIADEPGLVTVFWLFLSAAVCAPLLEELIFRVYLQSFAIRWIGAIYGVIATSILFGTLHGFPDGFPLILFALFLGVKYYDTGRYITVVTAHAFFNALMLTMTFLVGQ